MPVRREQYRVQSRENSRAVNTGDGGASGYEAVAAATGDIAGRAGQMMGALAQQEARDIAGALVISADENGVPQLPKQTSGFMGIAARQAFDSTLQQRMDVRMRQSIDAELASVAERNQMNPEGFTAEASAVLDAMRGGVEPQMLGAFEDAGISAVTSMASRLGWLRAQARQRNAAEDFAGMVPAMSDDLTASVWASDEEHVKALRRSLVDTGALLRGREISDADYQAQLRLFDVIEGRTRINKMANEQGWSPQEMLVAAQKIREGSDPDLAGLVHMQARRQVASDLEQKANMLLQDAGRRGRALDEQAKRQRVATGGAQDSAPNRLVLDKMLAENVPGYGVNYWHQPQTDERVLETVRVSQMFPTEMYAAMQRFANGTLTGPAAQATYENWRAITEGARLPNGAPSRVGLTTPPQVMKVMQGTRAMEGLGFDFEMAYNTALTTATEGFDNETLAKRLTETYGESQSGVSNWFWTGSISGATDGPGKITGDQLNTALDKFLVSKIEKLGATVSPDSRIVRDARYVFKSLAMLPNMDDLEEVEAIVMRQVETAFPETKYIYENGHGVVARSSSAPEGAYWVPTDPSVWPLIGNVMPDIHDTPESWFDTWLGPKIAEAVDVEGFEPELGKNFLLVPDGMNTVHGGAHDGRELPTYRIIADIDGDGYMSDRLPDLLDPGPDFLAKLDEMDAEERSLMDIAAKEAQTELDQRLVDEIRARNFYNDEYRQEFGGEHINLIGTDSEFIRKQRGE